MDIKKDTLIQCKKTENLFVVTGKSKTHIYFSGYKLRGGIPKKAFHQDFKVLEGEQ